MSSPKARRKTQQAIIKARKKAKATRLTCKCGKVAFPSEHAASNVLLTGRSGHRIYKCEYGGWHTTSRKGWR